MKLLHILHACITIILICIVVLLSPRKEPQRCSEQELKNAWAHGFNISYWVDGLMHHEYAEFIQEDIDLIDAYDKQGFVLDEHYGQWLLDAYRNKLAAGEYPSWKLRKVSKNANLPNPH